MFVAKSTLGFKKQVLSLRMPSGAFLAKVFCLLEFSSKSDAWFPKAGSGYQNAFWGLVWQRVNAHWGSSGKSLLSVRFFYKIDARVPKAGSVCLNDS